MCQIKKSGKKYIKKHSDIGIKKSGACCVLRVADLLVRSWCAA
jgi:hypothetical protein